MKLQLKLDKKAIQQFFLDHAEKIVLAGIAVCFLLVTYHAITREGFIVQGQTTRQDSKPENLKQAVDNAKANIERPYDPKRAYDKLAGDFKFNEAIHGFRGRVDPQSYAMVTRLYQPVSPSTILRGMPTVLPVERLVAQMGRGPVAGDGKGGAGPVGGQPGAGGQVHGRRWVLLKGLVPLGKQKEVYKGLYGNATFQDPKCDSPEYRGFFVQRTDVTPGSSAAGERGNFYLWTAKSAEGPANKGVQQGADVVDGKFVEPALCCPLPQVSDRVWGPEVAYPPEIPATDKLAPGETLHAGGIPPLPRVRDGRGPAPAAKGDEPDDLNPKSGHAAGQLQTEEEKGPAYLLLRFFDFDVQPGRQYRYRVFLVLANPNEGKDVRSVQDPEMVKSKFIGLVKFVRGDGGTVVDVQCDPRVADWSMPSSPVAVPEDVELLAFGVQMPSKPGQEPSGTTRVVSWSKNLGINAWHEYSVVRGKIVDFKADVTYHGQHVPVDFFTGDLIVDLAGEPIAPRDRSPVRRNQILVWESGRLVIHDKDVDEERFKALVPPKLKEKEPLPIKTKVTPGGRVKTKPGDLDLDDGGVFEKPTGKSAGKR
jgi:hypothetical protein